MNARHAGNYFVENEKYEYFRKIVKNKLYIIAIKDKKTPLADT